MSLTRTAKVFYPLAAATLAVSSLAVMMSACVAGEPEDAIDPEGADSAITAGSTLYQIKSDASGKVLDVQGLSQENGARVMQFTPNGGANQQWRIERSGSAFQLVSASSGKCLDVTGVSRADGALLQQWGCSGGANQQWTLRANADGSFDVVSVNSGKCLDVPGGRADAGLQLQQWTCTDAKAQHFRFVAATPPPAFSSLKAAAESRGLLAGIALSAGHFDDQAYLDLAAREFDYVTPENELKWTSTEPSPGNFTLAGADKIVNFAQAHGMKVKGHTLVWHEQLPGWVEGLSDPNQVRQAMLAHINKLVGTYKGKVLAWDVVNEAIDNGNGNALRDDVFHKLGDTYIDEAFRAAHAADPGALLFYNDYGIEGLTPKANAAYALVKRLVQSGVPIHGIGFQMHIGVDSPSAADIAANLKRFTDLGVRVNFSELDVNVCGAAGDQASKFAQQKQRYHDVIAACAKNAKCHAVTVWGSVDKYSWLNSFRPCTGGETGSPWPLPFNDSYARKPAWQGMVDAFSGR